LARRALGRFKGFVILSAVRLGVDIFVPTRMVQAPFTAHLISLGSAAQAEFGKSALLAEAFWLFSKTLSASHVIKTLDISHVT